MMKPVPSFNRKSAGLLAAVLLLALPGFFAGCKSADAKNEKKDKQVSFLRLHLETNPDGTRHSRTVPIYRAHPMSLTVEAAATLDEGFMSKAEVVDVDEHGGYALKITFNEEGARRLDYLTTANKGKRIAVLARWTEDRWLAAPLLSKRIANGVFIFTPDASREECERIVRGLENVIKKLSKPYTL
jgi:preprotein translocase subunit SecD